MDIESATRIAETSIKFVANSGLRVVELRRGYCKCVMPLKGNENHIGTMYAGALFTLADIPVGALFLASFDTAEYYAVVKGLNLTFLKPARTDITTEFSIDETVISTLASAAERLGKADFVLEADLVGDSGEVVAKARGLFHIRKIAKH
jgi:acyl-coenzyme A thioesterase PaaI-like protein